MTIIETKLRYIKDNEHREEYYTALTFREKLQLWFPNKYTYDFYAEFPQIKRWWHLTKHDFDTDIYHTWRSKRWWWILKWQILKPIFEWAIRHKIWVIKEGARYTTGKFWFQK